MAEILKYFYTMNLFIFLIILPAKICGGKPFFLPFSHFPLNSYTTFYNVLLTLCYHLFLLQNLFCV